MSLSVELVRVQSKITQSTCLQTT